MVAGPGGAGVAAIVIQSTYVGSLIRYELQTGAGMRLRATRPSHEARRAAGDAVHVSWKASDAVVLDA